MITLITGVPGAGKTALAVRELLALRGERPVFSNINGLKIDHFPIDHVWVSKWHENAPEDALIVIDEAQHSFRPRPQGSRVPENVAAFETHRHMGVDFILITQRPTLIDANIRGLVGRYLHVRQTALSRMIHEAPEVVNFQEKSTREENAKVPYKLPREVFSLYTSSQLHTKKSRPRLPTAVYMLVAAAIGLTGLGWYAFDSISDRTDNAPGAPAAALGDGRKPAPLPPGEVGAVAVDGGMRLKLATLPTDPDNPLSAPLYEPVAPPVVAPEVVGCIASASRCRCYTQQRTPIWLPEEQCRLRVAGEYYDPYRQPVLESKTGPLHPELQSSPGGLAGGFDDGTEPDVPRSPEGVAPPSGARVSGEPLA